MAVSLQNNLKQITMKKILLPCIILLLTIGCSSDDDETQSIENQIIRFTQIDVTNDVVTLTNFGNEITDVASYWLCLGPGRYIQVQDAASGTTNLEPNASVTISFNVDEDASGLSLFTTNTFGSSNPDVLIDYLQYGAADQPRVNQAIEAGRWSTNNEFINSNNILEFNGNATDVGATFWE